MSAILEGEPLHSLHYTKLCRVDNPERGLGISLLPQVGSDRHSASMRPALHSVMCRSQSWVYPKLIPQEFWERRTPRDTSFGPPFPALVFAQSHLK